jgi:hypothetical protein
MEICSQKSPLHPEIFACSPLVFISRQVLFSASRIKITEIDEDQKSVLLSFRFIRSPHHSVILSGVTKYWTVIILIIIINYEQLMDT